MRWASAQVALNCPSTRSLIVEHSSRQEKPSPTSASRASPLQRNQDPSAWDVTPGSMSWVVGETTPQT
eukprot:14475635-Alexandrium_andersonii.AAC.1